MINPRVSADDKNDKEVIKQAINDDKDLIFAGKKLKV